MKHFPRRTAEPAADPLGLTQALEHLRLDEADSADYVSTLISVARQQAEDRTERTLMPSTWTLRLPAFPAADGGAIELLRPPIIGVTSVQYLDTAGTLQTVAPADYVVDTQSEPGRLLPLAGSWPATAAHPQAVTIVYTAGYASAAAVPTPIKQWMLLAMGDLFELRQRSSDKPALPQDFADGLLAPYRLLGV